MNAEEWGAWVACSRIGLMRHVLMAAVLVAVALPAGSAAALHFPNYGNTGPGGLQDCTFAAAADYEIIVSHGSVQPTTPQIEGEYLSALDGASALSFEQMVQQWQTGGIGGVTVRGVVPMPATRADVEQTVPLYGALLVAFHVQANAPLATTVVFTDRGVVTTTYRTTSGDGHTAVLVGSNSTGPVIVTWGRRMQMTWRTWSQDAIAIYQVEAA